MRVLLVNPRSSFLLDPMVFAPLGLWFVGAAVEQAGHEVDFVDLNAADTVPFGYDAYLVTGTTPQLRSMLDVPRRLGRGPITIAGGPHASIAPADLLRGGYRWAVRGEGEPIIAELLEGKHPEGVVSVPRSTTQPPHPIRRWANQYHYTLDTKPSTHAMFSRGCPWQCAFCCPALWGGKPLFHSLEWCEAELDAIVTQSYNGVMFYDDTFTIDRRRVEAIGKMLQARHLVWRCFVRADTVDDAMAETLATYGCVEVGMGVESGNDYILSVVGKRTTAKDNTQAVKILHKHGVRVKAFLIVGLPGETETTIQDTEHWIRSAQPDDYDVTIFVPYPGSPIHQHPEKYDVQWDGMEASLMWYKGVPGRYSSPVWTSGLSRQRITELRDKLEAMKGEINGQLTPALAGRTKP